MIANIWAYWDLLQQYISSLNPWFDVFHGKPIAVVNDTNCYFHLVSNSEKLWDDSTWTNLKEAVFDFIIISWNKATPDVVIYEMLDTLSNLIITDAWERVTLPTSNFIIYSIKEWQQSGVLHDVNENPYLMTQYRFIYKYRYDASPRI